jgi:hypothetical protein
MFQSALFKVDRKRMMLRVYHGGKKKIAVQHRRTLEEVFYITYIMYMRYVNPITKSRCEIEEAMNYLLALRVEYLNGLEYPAEKILCSILTMASHRAGKGPVSTFLVRQKSRRVEIVFDIFRQTVRWLSGAILRWRLCLRDLFR